MFKNSRVVLMCILVLMVSLTMTSCATLFATKTKVVNFDSDPQGADVYINGNRMGKTPMPLKLDNKIPVTVTFKKEGMSDKTYIINTKVGAVWVVLDILGGLIPVIVDAATGSWTELDSGDVKMILDVEKK